MSSSNSNIHTVQVSAENSGMRLDQWLTQALGVSRNKIQKAVRDGRVCCAGAVIERAKHSVSDQETYEVCLIEEMTGRAQAQTMPLNIVYEDEDLIVLNKPAGLVVHPGAGNPDQTLVNGLLAHCGDGDLSGANGAERPGIVHRLDKDTSGLFTCQIIDHLPRGTVVCYIHYMQKQTTLINSVVQQHLIVCQSYSIFGKRRFGYRACLVHTSSDSKDQKTDSQYK